MDRGSQQKLLMVLERLNPIPMLPESIHETRPQTSKKLMPKSSKSMQTKNCTVTKANIYHIGNATKPKGITLILFQSEKKKGMSATMLVINTNRIDLFSTGAPSRHHFFSKLVA